MFLLARAAGLNHSQIGSAFKNDSNLATDRANLKTAHEAMMICVVSGTKDCSIQITSFSKALQTLAQERMTVWGNLFKDAPNPSGASNVYAQLKQLRSARMQIFQSVHGLQGAETTPPNE
jgi:hypothetical protein